MFPTSQSSFCLNDNFMRHAWYLANALLIDYKFPTPLVALHNANTHMLEAHFQGNMDSDQYREHLILQASQADVGAAVFITTGIFESNSAGNSVSREVLIVAAASFDGDRRAEVATIHKTEDGMITVDSPRRLDHVESLIIDEIAARHSVIH